MRCTDATTSGPRKKKASGVRAKSGFPQRVPSFFFGGTQSPRNCGEGDEPRKADRKTQINFQLTTAAEARPPCWFELTYTDARRL